MDSSFLLSPVALYHGFLDIEARTSLRWALGFTCLFVQGVDFRMSLGLQRGKEKKKKN